jgi:hypothetical protein
VLPWELWIRKEVENVPHKRTAITHHKTMAEIRRVGENFCSPIRFPRTF